MSAKKKTKTKEVAALYMGRRLVGTLGFNQKVYQAFEIRVGDKHEIRYFTGIHGLYIGKFVMASVVGDRIKMSKRPETSDLPDLVARPTDGELDKWWAEDKAAEAFLAKQRAQKKIKTLASVRLSPELAKLKQIYLGLDPYSRAYFRDYIYHAFSEKPKRRKARGEP